MADSPTPASGPVGRARASLRALEVLHELEQSGGEPTADQLQALRVWAGWGPMAPALEPELDRTGAWKEIGARLEKLLEPERYAEAQASTYNAFYTPEAVSGACWGLLKGMGFERGRVLEPGCGAGAFIGTTPEGVDAEWVGVERDPTTAAIARFLHPEATIIARPLQEAHLHEGSIDAVIGNVPFGHVDIFDPIAPKAVKSSLHDYAIWSSVRALAPGGIAVLVTSTGTLDKTNADARKAIDKEAVLLGAIRLPNGAFSEAGTNVATDILVLRRRKGDEPAPRKKDDPVATDPLVRAVQEKTWLSTSKIHYLPEGNINQWYARFTDGVLGTLTHAPVPGRSPVKVAADQDRPWQEALAAEVTAITDRVQTNDLGWDVLQAPRPLTDEIPQREDGLREGQMLVVERQVPRRNGGVEVKPVLAQIGLGQVEELRTDRGNLRPATAETHALIELRDAALALFEADADLSLTNEQVQPARDRAHTLHQAYVAEYGLINRAKIEYKLDPKTGEETVKRSYPKLGGMRLDVDFPSLAALEKYDRETNTAVPADILHRRVNVLPEGVDRADNPHEAVAMSLNQANRVDVDIIADLLELPHEQVEPTLTEAQAAFRDPDAPNGPLVPAGQYLSGSLGRRLERARQAAETDDAYQVNVEALEEVLPQPRPPEKIDAVLGAAWIPPADVQVFATELLGGKVEVDKYQSTGEWVVDAADEVKGYTEDKVHHRGTVANIDDWGSTHFRGDELLDKALNNRTPTVWKTERTRDGERRVVDKKATRAASVAMERIQARFSEWVWEDPLRADRLAAVYNRDFVSTRRPAHDGSNLTFPGLSAAITPYETQKNFVAMALSRQGSICAHEMGGGKTLTMFLTAIKHVQLGLVTNPIIVVPNHLLQDITRDGKLAFPSARILMATNEDLVDAQARKRFAAKCAANSWDAIVMTESMFSRIPVHPRTEADFHAEQKANKAATLQADAERIGRRVKSVAQKVDSHSSQVKSLLSSIPKDDGFCDELLNSSMRIFDEASDWMRNLGMVAQADGFNMPSPARTMNGFLKAQRTLKEGGKVLLFTGTPLVDKALELYVQMLMVHKEGLEERGIFSAEDWVRTFVKFDHVPEPTIDGGVKLVKRPTELINKPQLQEMYDECADVQRGIVARPELVQVMHKLETTPVQAAHAQELGEREKMLRGWNTQPGDDTYFSLMSAGRQAALDPHLAGLPEDGHTKLDEMADQIALRYHDNKHVRFPGDPVKVSGTLQLAFINLGVPLPAKGKKKADDRSYGRLRDKLIARGVPANTIRFVHEAKNADQRSDLFVKARTGEISVLVGSFRKMGYGTNVQDRLSDVHIADPTWNAADMQQAIKRGHRPGNKNTSVTAHFYPVTGTVDARMYSLNFQKISVEEQFFIRDGAQRMSAKFGEITASDFGSLAAAASDNEVLQQLEQIRIKLEVLEMEASGFRVQQTRVSARVEERLQEIGKARKNLDQWTILAEASGRATDDLVRLSAGGHVIDDKDMNTTLGGAAKDVNASTNARRDLVDYKNLRVSIVALYADRKRSVAAEVMIIPEASETLTAATKHHIPLPEAWFKPGQYWRITDAVKSFIDHLPNHVLEAQDRVQSLEQENTRAHQLAMAHFPRQDELNALRSEHDELLHAMQEENSKARTLNLHVGEELVKTTHRAQIWRRPPVGWLEVDGAHRPALIRALHGLHWVLTDAEAPFSSSERFLAEIIGRTDGLVEARLHVLPEVGTRPGTERIAVHTLHSTFGQALKELRDHMVEHLDEEGLQKRLWNFDISRLDDANPHSLLREATQDVNDTSWTLSNAHEVPLTELTGTYCLIRAADGTATASKITRVEDNRVLTDVGTFPRADVLEALSLDPRIRRRYRADEQPWQLQSQPLTTMSAAPGAPISARSAAVHAALRDLGAAGEKVTVVVDANRVPYLTTPGVEHIRISAHTLADTDDAHVHLHLHLPITVPTLHGPTREHPGARAKIPPPLNVPLRVPLAAISEITVNGTTWTYKETEQERAAEGLTLEEGEAEQTLSSETLTDEAFEVLPFHADAVAEHLETARRAAADEDHPQALVELGRALLASYQEQGHPVRAWVALADRVATGLGSHGDHVLALQVRRTVAAAAPDTFAWRERTSGHVYDWAAAHPAARTSQVDALITDLLHRKTASRRQLEARFTEVETQLADLLHGEHYADAAHLLQSATETLAAHTGEGRWHQIRTHFDTVVTAAALGRNTQGASTRPTELTVPDGLGMLWGRSVVALFVDGDLRTIRIASVTADHRLVTTDGQSLTTDQVRQIRTTDNGYMVLAGGSPGDLERALADHGERSAQDRATRAEPFHEHLTGSLNKTVTLLGEDNTATVGVLDRIADAGLRLTIGEESHLVPFDTVACVRTEEGRSWWTDPKRQSYALDQAQARDALEAGDFPRARTLVRQAQTYWEHISTPTPIMRTLREELEQLHTGATMPRTPGGALLVQIERTGPQGRIVHVYGAGGALGQDGQAALEDLFTAPPALIPAPELNAFTVDPTWRESTVNGRLDQLRDDLAAAGIACEVVGVTDRSEQPSAPEPVPESEVETSLARPPVPDPEPTQLSARPELRTLDFHGANQAIKEALKRGNLATAQRIHEFRIDPREGGVPNAAQQPGYELFAVLGNAIRRAQTVDEAVLRVLYRARDTHLKHGKVDEALRLLTLAGEISPEDGQHMAKLRQVHANLQAQEAARKKKAQAPEPAPERIQEETAQTADSTLHPEPEPPAIEESHPKTPPAAEEAVPSPEPAPAPTPADEPDGLFAVEPQAPTAEDVQRALDNVAAIPNPVGVFNAGQIQLIARARRANARGDIAEAAAALTHPWMKEGKAASKLQAAVGHLVRFAPANEDRDAPTPPVPPKAPTQGSQGQEAAGETPKGIEHLVRAVIHGVDGDLRIYVPTEALTTWREAITRHGLHFDDNHAPWALALGENSFKKALRGLREELSQLTDPPLFLSAKAWHKRMREALGPQVSDERLRQLRDIDQHRAQAKIQELITAGDVRAAYAVMTEHTTALRQAGLLPDPWVLDPDKGLADLYPVPQKASRVEAETLQEQIRHKDSWSAKEVADLAEQFHRRCPHLNAEQVAEILPNPSSALSVMERAQAAVEGMEDCAAGNWSAQGRGYMDARAILTPALQALRDVEVEHEQVNDLFVRANRADPQGAWERERIRSQLLYPAPAPDTQEGDPVPVVEGPPPGGWTEADRVKPITPAEFTPGPDTDPAERAVAAIEGIGDTVPLRQEHRTFWDGLDQALVDLREQGRHQEIIDLVARVREQNYHHWWRWETHRSRATAALNPNIVDQALLLHHARTDNGKAETHLYGVAKSDKDLHRLLKRSPLNLNHKVTENRWQVDPRWGRDKHELRLRDLIRHFEDQGLPYLAQHVHTELIEQRSSNQSAPKTAPADAETDLSTPDLAQEPTTDVLDGPTAPQLPSSDDPSPEQAQDELSQDLTAEQQSLLRGAQERGFLMMGTVGAEELAPAPTPETPATPPEPNLPDTPKATRTPASTEATGEPAPAPTKPTPTQEPEPKDTTPAPVATPTEAESEGLSTVEHQAPTVPDTSEAARLDRATQTLEKLRTDPSSAERERFIAAVQTLFDHDQHSDVQDLIHSADLIDPQGWWERADLLSRARFTANPGGLAYAARIDYDGAKTIIVHLTGDDKEQPVRELLKDKSGPYKARYDGKAQHWKIKKTRLPASEHREILANLLDDLSRMARTWVTENVHTELTEQHRVQAETALAAAGTVAPINDAGHVGALADVLTYPSLRVSAVIRHKDDNGEPRDSWTVVYDTGQGAKLTEYVTTQPTVQRGQLLTDVQVKIHDHTFSARGDARTVIIRIPPRQERSFPLTPEQEQIRASALNGQKIVVQAGAGTGKTATMGVVAESMAEQDLRGIYVVYGRANADEASVKLAHVPVAANTIHAFARRAVGGPYHDRITGDRQPNWKETAKALGLQSMELSSGQPLDGEDLARLVDRTVRTFELSADLTLTTDHIPHLPGLSSRDQRQVQRTLEPVLDQAWADMCDPAGHLFRYRHDTYVKIWQLTPGGPQMHIGGQGRPYLLVDEAQDMNPVAEAILQAQTHMQQIWVGDSSQAIHGWRGAKDALINQNPDVELTLTQSFRFGKDVATEANKWLGAIDAPLRVKGTPSLDTVVHDRTVEAPDAVLARTNAGAFNAALAQLHAGRRVAIVGGTDDLTRLIDAADKLQSDKRTTHPDLSHFRTWSQVVKCAFERPEDLGSLVPFVHLVEKLGTSAVRDALSQMTDTDPEVEVCTAHKSKGLEWDRVQIADDFSPKENQEWTAEEFKAEAQLAYVATTRARRELGRGSLAYIDDYVGTASAHTAAQEASQKEEHADPTSTQAPAMAQEAQMSETPEPTSPADEPAVQERTLFDEQDQHRSQTPANESSPVSRPPTPGPGDETEDETVLPEPEEAPQREPTEEASSRSHPEQSIKTESDQTMAGSGTTEPTAEEEEADWPVPEPDQTDSPDPYGNTGTSEQDDYYAEFADEEDVAAGEPEPVASSQTAATTSPSDERAARSAVGPPSIEEPPSQQANPGTDQDEEDTASNRARASRGTGPLRSDRRHLHIDMPGDEEEEQRRALHVEVPASEHPTTETPPSAEEENTQQRATSQGQEQGQEQPTLTPPQGPKGTLIDGRKIRAADKRWQRLLEGKGGRSAARKKVDPKVYEQMRKQLKKALDNDTDVHLVMPTNDLEQLRQFISMAREYGYEITLSARIPPEPVRVLETVEQLNSHLHKGHPERAISATESRQEYANLREILSTVHQEHLVDRVECYPREGVTTDPTSVIRNHLIGDQDNPRWSLGGTVEEHISFLERSEVSADEDHRLRTRVPEIAQGLLPDEVIQQNQPHLKWAHDQIKDGVNYLARTNAERQPFKDAARRTTITTNEEAVADHKDSPAAPSPEPFPNEHTQPAPEHHKREPAMAGAPPTREEALSNARMPHQGHPRRPPSSPRPPHPGAPGHQPSAGAQPQRGPRLG